MVIGSMAGVGQPRVSAIISWHDGLKRDNSCNPKDQALPVRLNLERLGQAQASTLNIHTG